MRYILVVFLWHLPDADRLSSDDWMIRETAQRRIESAGILGLPTLWFYRTEDAEAARRLHYLRGPRRNITPMILACWIVADRNQRPDSSSLDWVALRDTGVGDELIRMARQGELIDEREADSYRAIIADRAAGISTLADLVEIRMRARP